MQNNLMKLMQIMQQRQQLSPEEMEIEKQRQLEMAKYGEALQELNNNVDPELRAEGIDTQQQLALTDSLTGSKLSRNFKPEASREEKLMQNIAVLQRMRPSKKKSSGVDLSDLLAIERLAQGDTRIRQADKHKQQTENRLFDQELSRKSNAVLEKMDTEFEKVSEGARKFKSDIGPLARAFQSGRVSDIKKRIARVAKYIGGHTGVLSDTDIKTTMGSDISTTYEEARDWILNKADATISKEQQKIYLDIISQVISNSGKIFDVKVNGIKQRYYRLAEAGHSGFARGTKGIDLLHDRASKEISDIRSDLKQYEGLSDSVSTKAAAPQKEDKELTAIKAEYDRLKRELGAK